MAKYSLARQLTGKKVITNEGEEFGKLVDMNINEITGKIEELVVDPNPDKANLETMKDEDGFILCPYDSVLAVGDFIIVEKKSMAAQS